MSHKYWKFYPPPPFSQLNASSYRLVIETMTFHKKKQQLYYQNTIGIKKIILKEKTYCLCSSVVYVNCLHRLCSHHPCEHRVVLGARSCFHWKLHQSIHCFPPPIPERQQWSNLGIRLLHDCLMMTSSYENVFDVIGSLRQESTGHQWIPLIKGRWRGHWCFQA